MRQNAQGLHGYEPYIYMVSSLVFFCGFLRVRNTVFLIVLLFSFYSFVLSNSDVLVLFHLTVFYFIRSLFFFSSERKGVDPDKRRGGEEPGGVEGDKIVINI